jgi:N-acylneuraminate cytidylyltransferase
MGQEGCIEKLIEGNFSRRQDAPEAFDLTTLAYVTRPNFIVTHQNLWQGSVRGVLIPQERAIDIDTELDFRIAEFLMRENIGVKNKKC